MRGARYAPSIATDSGLSQRLELGFDQFVSDLVPDHPALHVGGPEVDPGPDTLLNEI